MYHYILAPILLYWIRIVDFSDIITWNHVFLEVVLCDSFTFLCIE